MKITKYLDRLDEIKEIILANSNNSSKNLESAIDFIFDDEKERVETRCKKNEQIHVIDFIRKIPGRVANWAYENQAPTGVWEGDYNNGVDLEGVKEWIDINNEDEFEGCVW